VHRLLTIYQVDRRSSLKVDLILFSLSVVFIQELTTGNMVLLGTIPEFSTMCMSALAAFESINSCKGAVLDGVICNESAWFNDCRDEGVEMEGEVHRSCRASEKEGVAPLRQPEDASLTSQGEPSDTVSLSSSINPAIIQSSFYTHRRHIKLDSVVTFLSYDDDDIFRSRQASLGSDSQCFRLCRLDRCKAFSSSQDSAAESSSNVHPLKRDPPAIVGNPEVRLVHWDELVEDSVVNTRTIE
jgi:hypothetical protein